MNITHEKRTTKARIAIAALAVIACAASLPSGAGATPPPGPKEIQEHCQWYWLSRQCFLVIQPYTVQKMQQKIDRYPNTSTAVAAGAAGAACLVMSGNPVAALICATIGAVAKAYFIDVLKVASVAGQCLEFRYFWLPGQMRYLGIGFSAKPLDGGWCGNPPWSNGCSGFIPPCGEAGGGGGGGSGGSW